MTHRIILIRLQNADIGIELLLDEYKLIDYDNLESFLRDIIRRYIQPKNLWRSLIILRTCNITEIVAEMSVKNKKNNCCKDRTFGGYCRCKICVFLRRLYKKLIMPLFWLLYIAKHKSV